MPKVSTSTQAGYSKLLKSIQKQIVVSKRKIEQQTVLTYHSVGQVISFHLKSAVKMTQRYRSGLYLRLAQDLQMDQRVLYQAVQFYETYPKLDYKKPLTWSHYRYLCQLQTDKDRARWEKRIIKDNISINSFLTLMKAERLDKISTPIRGKLKITRGLLHHYRVVKRSGAFLVDCGFENYIVPPKATGQLNNTRIYRSDKVDSQYRLFLSKSTVNEIYIFSASIDKIVDADTLRVTIDCGFGVFHREILRLRGINAPEKSTIDGVNALKRVEEILKPCSVVVVKTYKADKYGRYLADVFYIPKEMDAHLIALEGTLLNQQLLDEGWAEEWKP